MLTAISVIGHNLCQSLIKAYIVVPLPWEKNIMSPATLRVIGPQYVPRVPASDVAGDNMCRGDNIC